MKPLICVMPVLAAGCALASAQTSIIPQAKVLVSEPLTGASATSTSFGSFSDSGKFVYDSGLTTGNNTPLGAGASGIVDAGAWDGSSNLLTNGTAMERANLASGGLIR